MELNCSQIQNLIQQSNIIKMILFRSLSNFIGKCIVKHAVHGLLYDCREQAKVNVVYCPDVEIEESKYCTNCLQRFMDTFLNNRKMKICQI